MEAFSPRPEVVVSSFDTGGSTSCSEIPTEIHDWWRCHFPRKDVSWDPQVRVWLIKPEISVDRNMS